MEPTSTPRDPLSAGHNGEAGEVPSRAAELGERVTAAIDSKRDSLAYAMEDAADYLRDQDLRAMLSDVRDTVTRHPGAALLVAGALGFVIARALTRD